MLEEVIKIICESNELGRIKKFSESFVETSNFYYIANENTNGYINEINFNSEMEVLTVLASGDQVLNLVNKGVFKIDSFDINCLSEYFALGIKVPMVKAYSYEEYFNKLKFLVSDGCTPLEQYNIFLEIKPYMDDKYALFWEKIFLNSILKGHTIPVMKILSINNLNIDLLKLTNNYCVSEREYYNTKKNLESAIITFKICDVFDLNKVFMSKYDKVFLSNIIDYFYKTLGNNWEYEDLLSYGFEDLLKEDGELFLGYLFKYYSFVRGVGRRSLTLTSNAKESDLINGRIINFRGVNLEKNSLSDKVGDSVIITRR